MKVFISQPMNGKTDEQIKQERLSVIERLKHMFDGEIEIIDSFIEEVPYDVTPLWYLGESIKSLDKADVAFFCKDWEKLNGCTIEHECAVRYGIECMYA